MQHISYYQSPFGKILLASDEKGLTGLWFSSDRFYADNLSKNYESKADSYLLSAKKWLTQYFAGKKPNFTPQLHLQGTAFQLKVWQALLQISYGQIATYKEIAEKVSPNAKHFPVRAVGGAIGRNHLSLIVPCHRVIGSNGNLTGYAAGIDKKIQLLKLERIDTAQFSRPSQKISITPK